MNKELFLLKNKIKNHPFVNHSLGHYREMVDLITDNNIEYIISISIKYKYREYDDARYCNPAVRTMIYDSRMYFEHVTTYKSSIIVHYIIDGIKHIYEKHSFDIIRVEELADKFLLMEDDFLKLINELEQASISYTLDNLKINTNVDSKPQLKLDILKEMEDGFDVSQFSPASLSVKQLMQYYNFENLTIPKITYFRDPGNKKRKTFDFITVVFDIGRGGNEEFNYVDFIRENDKKLKRVVVNAIKRDIRYKKYGVPLNFLKIKNTRLLPGSMPTLEYTIVLKTES